MKKHPVWYLVIAISVLIIPTLVYLCFLVPKMTEEYNILMTSGGVIGGAGLYGASRIPEKIKYSGMFKLASNAFSIMTALLLVEKFIVQIIGLVAVFVVCFIAYKILMEVYRNARTRKQNKLLATEIARNATKSSE